jgi:glycosyltransferase involved in cell wall biosynthesis
VFCSTIIATIGRPSLARSVQSLLDQDFSAEDFEVIVVNDSGQPLLEESWQSSPRVRLCETQRRRQGVAQNTGAALARGRYLNFLDDDDWLLPGALAEFWELVQRQPQADWLYGGLQFVDANGNCLRECHPRLEGNLHTQMVAGVWIPAGASLIRSDAFFGVGGFNVLLRTSQDTDLARRVSYRGEMAYTPAAVICVLRGAGWSSSVKRSPDLLDANRQSRDMVLARRGVFGRLRASARTHYWRGRILQAYLAAALWNWQRRNFWSMTSRALYALLSLATSGTSIFVPPYWQAVRDDNVPFSYEMDLRNL